MKYRDVRLGFFLDLLLSEQKFLSVKSVRFIKSVDLQNFPNFSFEFLTECSNSELLGMFYWSFTSGKLELTCMIFYLPVTLPDLRDFSFF